MSTGDDRIPAELIIAVLEHWKTARKRLSKIEHAENLRCAVDIVRVLMDCGITVHESLWKERFKEHDKQAEPWQ